MPDNIERTRKEYTLIVEFSNAKPKVLNINLSFDATNPTYDLAFIDQTLHHIPDSIFMMQAICSINNLDYYTSNITGVYVINTRYPNNKKPVLYSEFPLPIGMAEAFQYLNHYRVLELFDSNIESSEIAKKKYEMLSRMNTDSESNAEFATKKFIDEVVKSYRLRRELTLILFKQGIYQYQTPEDLLPPSLDNPKQSRMF